MECFKPLLSMAVLSLVFSAMFRKSIENYPVYYLTGFILWNFFTTATNTAMTALADNQTLILQVKFPREVFPFARYIQLLSISSIPLSPMDHSADF